MDFTLDSCFFGRIGIFFLTGMLGAGRIGIFSRINGLFLGLVSFFSLNIKVPQFILEKSLNLKLMVHEIRAVFLLELPRCHGFAHTLLLADR